MTWLLLACAEPEPEPYTYPDVDAARPTLRGGGGPTTDFAEDALWEHCAYLRGDDEHEYDHHNLVMPYRGHLVLPWSPEFGSGGLSLFDMSDPCDPVKEGEGWAQLMRETHALGFLHLPEGEDHPGDYAATNGTLGIQIWDLTTLESPEELVYLQLPDIFYPDSYARPVLSLFWAHPWLYVAGADNGVYVVDTRDPGNPELASRYTWDPPLRAAGVFVIGDTLLVHAAEGTHVAMLDVSDPSDPQPIPGGEFHTADGDGETWEAYHGNVAGDLALFARKESGGGVMVYDWSDPSDPFYLGDVWTEGGNGGYVFYDEGYAFTGESHWGKVYDLRDLDDITEVGTGSLAGDLDTNTPYGNVMILSVDDDAEDEQSSAVVPWTSAPDTTGPTLLRVEPEDGQLDVALTSRVGLGFDEPLEPSSVYGGSVRLFDEQGLAVEGWGSAQENIATFTPKADLRPGTTYTIEVVEGGIEDINANRLEQTWTSTFTTRGGS